MKKSGKILYKLKKEKARTHYIIQEDPDEPTFIYVRRMEKNNEKYKSMVILKDLPDYIKGLQNLGWVISSE